MFKIGLLTTDNREHFKNYSATKPFFGTAPEALLQGFAGMPGVEVHVVSCARAVMSSPEKLASNIFFHELHVPRIGWWRTLFLGCIVAARKKLRQIRPNIVHGQGTEGDCAISAVFSGFPNVLTIHGNMRLIAKVTNAKAFSFPWMSAKMETFTVPRSRGVVCITRYTQEAMRGLARKTWLLPNAVDESFFDIKPAPAPEGPPRVLCVGHVCPRKNQNAFIRALDSLAERRPFEVMFLGQTSPGRAYDDEFIGLVQSRRWCTHAGYAARDKLREYFRTAALVALPSLEDNCPMVVLEGMAAGVPVLAANVGGVPDLIKGDETGLLCDPLDAASMLNGVERALANPAEAANLSRNARIWARKSFHPKVVAEGHLNIYREVLDVGA